MVVYPIQTLIVIIVIIVIAVIILIIFRKKIYDKYLREWLKRRERRKKKEIKYPETPPKFIKEIKYPKMERDLNSLEKAQMSNKKINLEKENDREREKLREKLQ